MKITQFAQQLTQEDNLEKRKEACSAIKKIYHTYGKVASTKDFIQTIKWIDDNTYTLLKFLVENKLYTYHNIKYLEKEIISAYEKKYMVARIQIPSKYQSKVTKKRKNAGIDDTQTIGVTIHNQDKIYKRSLDTDLKKLLH